MPEVNLAAVLQQIEEDDSELIDINCHKLNLNDTDVAKLMQAIHAKPGRAARINSLDLSFNQLTKPPALTGLTALRWLYLQNNELTTPPWVTGCTVLKLLNLTSNQLTTPPVLIGLTALENCFVDADKLTRIGRIAFMLALEQPDNRILEQIQLSLNNSPISEKMLMEHFSIFIALNLKVPHEKIITYLKDSMQLSVVLANLPKVLVQKSAEYLLPSQKNHIGSILVEEFSRLTAIFAHLPAVLRQGSLDNLQKVKEAVNKLAQIKATAQEKRALNFFTVVNASKPVAEKIQATKRLALP